MKNSKSDGFDGNIPVWRKTMSLTSDIYRIAGFFPENEPFGIAEGLRNSVDATSKFIGVTCGECSVHDLCISMKAAEHSIDGLRSYLEQSVMLEMMSGREFERFDNSLKEIGMMLRDIAKRNLTSPSGRVVLS